MQVIRTAAALMVRSMVLSAQSAGQQRLLHLVRSAGVGGEAGEQWDKPEKSAKTLPADFERRFFPDTCITAYRLAA